MAALLASGGPALAAAPAAYDDLARIAGHA
jgi:hypothetical protein